MLKFVKMNGNDPFLKSVQSHRFHFTTTSSGVRIPFSKNKILKIFSFIFLSIWCWTLIDVADMTNWALENVPVFFFIFCIVFTYRNFKFSDLSYMMFLIFIPMHIYGAKYIYAHNPLGVWLQEQFNTERNQYDRLVHFSFGFLMSYPIREFCLNYFEFSRKISMYTPIAICLAIGAFYEILEAAVAGLFFPEQGPNFLGMQGDVWDPQKDMFLAGLGSVFFVLIFLFIKQLTKPKLIIER